MLRDSRDIVSRLRKEGWRLVAVRGSHHQFEHDDQPHKVTVPHPRKDLPRGTVRGIYKQAGWPRD